MRLRLSRAGVLPAAGLVGALALLCVAVLASHGWGRAGRGAKAPGRWISQGEPEILARLLVGSPSSGRGASLPSRKVDRAIQRQIAAVEENPRDFVRRSNLALAFLRRAQEADRPADLIDALEQIELAKEIAPHHPEVLYNRALLLTDLGLRSAARAAWESYLEVDRFSTWAWDARSQLRALREPTVAEAWEEEGRNQLLAAAQRGDDATCNELVRRYSTAARIWIEEELFPAWARALAAGRAEEASGRLAALRPLSRALAATFHDRSGEETLALFDRSPSAHASLVHGLMAFGDAMQLYRHFREDDEKNRLLETAARELAAVGSPLAAWARLYRGVGWHRSRPTTAATELERLRTETTVENQPALAACIEQTLGINEDILNRYETALWHYRRFRQLLLASEGEKPASFAGVLIGGTQFRLGDADAGWRALIEAMRELAPWGDLQRLHAALYPSVEQLLMEGRFAAARPWVEELLGNAERWQEPIGRAEAALQQGRLAADDGRPGEATVAFSRARDAAEKIAGAASKQRTLATIELYQGESRIAQEPRQALDELEDARRGMLALDYRYQLPRLDSARGLASLRLGDREGAMEALRTAIAEEEDIRGEISNEGWRATAFEGAQRAFDALIELALESPAGDAEAFAYAERARSRLLLDLIANDHPTAARSARPVDLDQLETELPEDVDLLELTVLPQRVIVWQVRRHTAKRFETAISSELLAEQARDLRISLERGDAEARVQERAAILWQTLLGPVAATLEPGRPLVIVPDRSLGRVSFGVLFDPDRRRYLVEDHPITIAPSASAYLAARTRAQSLASGPPTSILAVGANHPDAAELGSVYEEADEIGKLYPRGQVLTAAAATRDAFLAAGPDAEVIHFAGHNRDDAASPRRSRLLFQPANAGDTGFLFGEEIATLRLPGTRLVVLAACRSVNGGSRGRETVSGTAAAFLAAGVPAVIASLWDSDDKATLPLMKALHQNLRRGLAPSEALRRAQLELLHSDSPFRAPTYWAGFEVVGAE